ISLGMRDHHSVERLLMVVAYSFREPIGVGGNRPSEVSLEFGKFIGRLIKIGDDRNCNDGNEFAVSVTNEGDLPLAENCVTHAEPGACESLIREARYLATKVVVPIVRYKGVRKRNRVKQSEESQF